MTKLKVHLRAPEPQDLEQIYNWENNASLWLASNTTRPLSKATIQLYIESINDIFTDKQLRLLVEHEHALVGCVDLFEYDPLHQRAGVGIMIDSQYQGKGLATAALAAIKNYAFDTLGVHQLYCDIAANNEASIALFTRNGFTLCGEKKEWFRVQKDWVGLKSYQCFSNEE